MPSNFKYAMHLLGVLQKPLFFKMAQERRAYPMEIDISEKLIAEFPDKEARIGKGLAALARSKRYNLAMLEAGAVRYDAEGNAGAAVTDENREQAQRRLASIKRKSTQRAQQVVAASAEA